MKMAIGRALFGNNSNQSQSKNLVEFRAGKMELKGNMVHPDKRKGLIYIHQTDDSLMHFCWKDRTTGSTVDDLIIFPDDVEYKRVQQCTTGRVYLLKFKSTNRKLFFWMQEPKTDKDEEYCKKVNEYLNNPPAARSGGSTPGGLPSELSNLGDSDIQTLLNNMSQQQLVQFFGNVGGMSSVSNLSSILGSRTSQSSTQSSRLSSAASSHQDTSTTSATTATSVTTASSVDSVAPSSTTATPTTTSSSATSTVASSTAPVVTTTASSVTPAGSSASITPSPTIQLSDLQNILSGIRVPPQGDEGQSRAPIDLSTAVNSESLQPILSNPDFIQRLQNFIPQLDSTSIADPEQLRETFHSPQFQQAMSMFSTGLQSGQLGPLMQQFGLNEEAISAARQGDIETFVRALQNFTAKKSSSEDKTDKPGKKDKDDDDEDMALD